MLESLVGNVLGGVVSNVIQNSVSGFVEAGTRTAGGYAGDFMIKGGDIIENIGRGVGDGVAAKGDNWGNAIKGYYVIGPSGRPVLSKASTLSLGEGPLSTPRKPITSSSGTTRPKQLQRSYSSPSSSTAAAATASASRPKAVTGKPKTATYPKTNVPVKPKTTASKGPVSTAPSQSKAVSSSTPTKRTIAKESLPRTKNLPTSSSNSSYKPLVQQPQKQQQQVKVKPSPRSLPQNLKPQPQPRVGGGYAAKPKDDTNVAKKAPIKAADNGPRFF